MLATKNQTIKAGQYVNWLGMVYRVVWTTPTHARLTLGYSPYQSYFSPYPAHGVYVSNYVDVSLSHPLLYCL